MHLRVHRCVGPAFLLEEEAAGGASGPEGGEHRPELAGEHCQDADDVSRVHDPHLHHLRSGAPALDPHARVPDRLLDHLLPSRLEEPPALACARAAPEHSVEQGRGAVRHATGDPRPQEAARVREEDLPGDHGRRLEQRHELPDRDPHLRLPPRHRRDLERGGPGGDHPHAVGRRRALHGLRLLDSRDELQQQGGPAGRHVHALQGPAQAVRPDGGHLCLQRAGDGRRSESALGVACRGEDRVRQGHLPLRGLPAAGAEGREHHGAARREVRRRGEDGQWQVHAHEPAPAPGAAEGRGTQQRWQGVAGRRGRGDAEALGLAPEDRGGAPGAHALQHDPQGEHRRGVHGRGGADRPAVVRLGRAAAHGQGGRAHRRGAGGGPEVRVALGRPAAADHGRPGARAPPEGPHPRRVHGLLGQGVRGPPSGRPQHAQQRRHGAVHCAPPPLPPQVRQDYGAFHGQDP
mmetsp:Transcript_66389/g.205565  ORF Transcript_66389/g.205565 Transcript_66389/m.205565 type:complete len:462 (-) Transcript_66389:246-1631(-)